MDLTKLGQNLALRTLRPFLVYGIVFLIYYVMVEGERLWQ